MKKIFKGLIIFLALGFGFMLTLGATENAKMEDREVLMAGTLTEVYDKNEVSADERFKGKYVEIYGEVESISSTFGQNIVMVKSTLQKSIFGVQCNFKDSEKSKLAELRKGDFIRIVGKCEGKILTVNLKMCEVMEYER